MHGHETAVCIFQGYTQIEGGTLTHWNGCLWGGERDHPPQEWLWEFTLTAFPFHHNTLQSSHRLLRCAGLTLTPLLRSASLALLSRCLTTAVPWTSLCFNILLLLCVSDHTVHLLVWPSLLPSQCRQLVVVLLYYAAIQVNWCVEDGPGWAVWWIRGGQIKSRLPQSVVSPDHLSALHPPFPRLLALALEDLDPVYLFL